MGELILCRMPIAGSPYYIEEKGINIYSLEELSYYIANSTYLLTPAFMNRQLISWIGRELKEVKLEKELEELLDESTPLHIFCGHILESNGLLTPYEIRETVKKISELENKSEAECRKIRADSMRKNGHLTDSIYEYENLLDRKMELRIPIGLEGDIWHNLGSAYMGLFFFREAENCFRNAYEKNHRQQSLRALLMAFLVSKNEEGFQKEVDHFLVSPALVDEIRKTIKDEENREDLLASKDEILKEFEEDEKGRVQASDKTAKRLNDWKAEYIRQCRI